MLIYLRFSSVNFKPSKFFSEIRNENATALHFGKGNIKLILEILQLNGTGRCIKFLNCCYANVCVIFGEGLQLVHPIIHKYYIYII
jgi:hypothetical protein